MRRYQRQIARVAADELGLRRAVIPAANDRHPLVGHLVSVADGAVADQPVAQRLVVQRLVDPVGAVVDHTGGEQDGACTIFLIVAAHGEVVAVAFQVGYPPGFA